MNQAYFRHDNTDGYTDEQLDELNWSLYKAAKKRGLSFNPDSQDADQIKLLSESLLRTFDTQLAHQQRYDDQSGFVPTHKITVMNFDGEIDETLVHLDSDGAAYTKEEWDAEAYADWTYDEQDGWLFHGRPGPTGNCKVEVVAIKQ